MLPGLRLMAIGFLCSFVVVYAGLRMVAALNGIHAGMPVVAAQAVQTSNPSPSVPTRVRIAALSATPAVAPVLYDLRFVANPVAPQLASVTPQAIERMLPIAVPSAPPVTPLIEEAFKEFPAAAEPEQLSETAVIAAIDLAAAPALEDALTAPPPELTLPAPPSPQPIIAEAPVSDAAPVAPLATEPLVTEPAKPVEVAMIPPEIEPKLVAPKPAQAKIAKRAARHVRHRRHIRMAHRAAAAPAASGNPITNFLSGRP